MDRTYPSSVETRHSAATTTMGSAYGNARIKGVSSTGYLSAGVERNPPKAGPITSPAPQLAVMRVMARP